MNYRPLKNHYIKISANGQTEYDAGEGVILIPPENSKIFLHWTNEKGKLVTTYTLNYATLVQNKFKIINGTADQIRVHLVEFGKNIG